jgi:hypothetical protein
VISSTFILLIAPSFILIYLIFDNIEGACGRTYIHNKINAPKLPNTTICRVLQVIETSYINGANSNDPRTRSNSRDIFGGLLGLFNISSNNTRIGTQIDKSKDLSATDGPRSASTKDDLAL